MMTNPERGASHPCPLCERDLSSMADLRVHLMCNHRKSELTDEMLALSPEEPPTA